MTYPTRDVEREGLVRGARVVSVEAGSPAERCGIEPGQTILRVEGEVLRDYIDWMWLSDSDEIFVTVAPVEGIAYEILLERDEGEPWGLTFDSVIYDEVKRCRNACTFCFMTQLPRGMRDSLYVRDDDFRLSFLQGTFVTLTNMTPEDEERIIDQQLSPLRVSLHAVSPQVRRELIGKHADTGFEALERLHDAGIEFHAQIVLVPNINDGQELEKTLSWAQAHEGILTVGIVPLGFTKHQTQFHESFDEPSTALNVIKTIERFQAAALEERGYPWVYAADEFYMNAYGSKVADYLPDAEFYDGFSMYEDGIGMVRSFIDDWQDATNEGAFGQLGKALNDANVRVVMLTGEAMAPLIQSLVAKSGLADCVEVCGVKDDYFGGNVKVTGLLTGCDIVNAINTIHEQQKRSGSATSQEGESVTQTLFAVPDAIFNSQGITLDGMSAEDLSATSVARVCVVSCTARGLIEDTIKEL